jgi:hypothetical protein
MKLHLLTACLVLSLTAGCAAGPGMGGYDYYRLIRAEQQDVARGSMVVTPTIPWNRSRRGYSDIRREEDWTLNGPLLDSLTFIGALENDKRIIRQGRKADRKVPNFRADMNPQEISAMVESLYRIRGGAIDFRMTGLRPRDFLGRPGFQLDFEHLGGDEVERSGRAVGAVVDGRLYLAMFDAAKMHYFPAGLPEFDRIADSARLKR